MTDLPCACATARQLARMLTHLYDAQLRGTGIEAPQCSLMLMLDKLGALSQADLGRKFGLDKTTVSRNLRLLERNGWIESAASKDKRKRQFVLTPSGRKRLEAAKPKWKKAQDELRSAMSSEEWDAMFRVFRNVAQAAQSLQDS
jgi:DNA-binding MarR family transcriptional regulator